MAASEVAELYVRSSDLVGLASDRRLRPVEAGEPPNVYLRVVDDEVWPFGAGERYAPPVVAAVDLVEVLDHRSADEVLRIRSEISA